jgi:hypothetical protein
MSDEEKAINLLQSADIDKETGEVQWHTWYKGIDEDVKKAFDIAIRHIQAWDKIKEEIKNTVTINDDMVEVMRIIDKNLQEIT